MDQSARNTNPPLRTRAFAPAAAGRSSADIVIIGGGIAGLWCRWALENAGYSVALIERSALGDGQTVRSQGILHRGVKYAFSPQGANAAQSAQAAASAWDDAMRGKSGPDLRRVNVLAKSMLMWTSPGIIAKMTGAVASRMMTSHVRSLSASETPPLLANRTGNLYEVAETVLEPRSAVQLLAAASNGPIVRADVQSIERNGDRLRLRTTHGPIETSWIILASGAGNERLLEMIGTNAGELTQRRPLHMVSATGAPSPLFGHWIAHASDKPRLTITSDVMPQNEVVWYLGGDIAETGVNRSPSEQIAAARKELSECFPTMDTSGWRFDAFRIDRAEGKDAAGRRPDGPVVRAIDSICTANSGVLAIWPTKLVMAPIAAEMALKLVAASSASRSNHAIGFSDAARPDYASPPWRTQK